jgi:hypothetical protein
MLSDGGITRVGHGDRVGGWTVATVSDDFVRLSSGSERRTLRLIHR